MKQRDRGHVDWERAVALRQTGLSYAKIAERLGCNPSAAYYAVNHERMRRKRRALARPRRDPWTAEEILAALVEFDQRHGRPPKHSDLGRDGLPWAMTVERRFGTLNKALVAAGLPTRPTGRPLICTDEAIAEREAAA